MSEREHAQGGRRGGKIGIGFMGSNISDISDINKKVST
jgi:hypothetical protein